MPQLAEKIRSKYPGMYDDLDDDTLEKSVLSKHPEYQDLVEKPKEVKTEDSSIFSKIGDTIKGFSERHPKISKFAEEFLTGSSAETEKARKEAGFAEVKGPGLMEIPGVHKFTDRLAQDITGSEGNLRLGAGAVVKALGDIVATGFDPRNVGVAKAVHDSNVIDAEFRVNPESPSGHPELPPIRRSSETPYRMGEPVNVENFKRSEDLPIRRARDIPPDLVPVGSEDIFNSVRPAEEGPKNPLESIFSNYKEKMNMGRNIEDVNPLSDFRESDRPIPMSDASHMTPEQFKELNEFMGSGPDEEALRYIRENAGRVPERVSGNKPTATYIGEQEGVGPLFNIEGGPRHKSTVTLETLQREGIDVPEYETSNKSGEQLRAEALEKKQQGTFKNPFVKQPEEAMTFDKPLAARTSTGKIAIGADIKSLGKVLGTSLYKGDIAPIATKELLQNSIDAVRHLGTEGKINVVFDRPNNTIHVTDNGKGLSRKELETVFTDLGASGKREDIDAAGGFGLAKAAPLLGGKKVEVISISKDKKTGQLIQNSFEGTPTELLSGVDIKEGPAPEGSQTGISVKVHVPENSDYYSAQNFVQNLVRNSHGLAADIKFGSHHIAGKEYKAEDIVHPLTKGENKTITKIKTPSANVELMEPKNDTRATRNYVDIHMLNNGMYQGTKPSYFNGEVPNVPESITVDIKPKVPEGHEDYPFTANREELRGTVEAEINKYINENIIAPGIGKRKDELQKLYETMPEMRVGKGEFPNNFGRKISLYDPKGQISSEEMNTITSNPTFQSLVNDIAGTLDEAMQVMNKPTWMERLEKVGIIFENKVHGIHIPNPGTKKSAILINPFIAIRDMSPDEAGANILHTILHELAHVEMEAHPGHNESFTIRLGEIYGKFGASRSIAAQDRIIKSITNNTGEYSDEIQDVLQRYIASRGNKPTTEDLLSGTGIKSESSGGGKGRVPKSSKSDGDRVTTQSAVAKLLEALEEAKGLQEEQTANFKLERARRFAAFEGVKSEGITGAAKSLGKLKGEYEKIDLENVLSDSMSPKEINALFTAVKRANITTGEKARGYTALFKLMDGSGIPQRNELKLLNDVFGDGFAEKILELHGGLGVVGMKIGKVANTMKALRSSLDLSAPLRQGIGLIHRSEFRDAFAEMFKYLGNKKYYDAAMTSIEQRPNYLLGREAGLFLAKPDDLLKGEEAFLNNYTHAIPRFTGLPGLVDASERAYTGFLNSLRADTFDNLVKNAKAAGHETFTIAEDEEGNKTIVPSKVTENLAKYINVSTGRGGLGKLEKIASEMNTLIWSPRLISSRLSILNPQYYMNMDKFTRMEAIKSLFAIAAAGISVAMLGKLAGAKVSTDIQSSDFMKARFGNNVLDPYGGFQQPIVAAARFISGESNGKPQSRTTTLENFSANKLSPMAALAYELASAQKWTGKPGEFISRYGQKKNVSTEISNSFTPMFIQDVTDVFKNDPSFAEQVGLDTASLFGMGVQNYSEKKPNALGFRKMSIR